VGFNSEHLPRDRLAGPYTALSFTLIQERPPQTWLTSLLALRGAVLLTAGPVGAAHGGPLTAAATPAPCSWGPASSRSSWLLPQCCCGTGRPQLPARADAPTVR